MKKKLSKRQLDVMKVLWDHSSPMVASDIVNGCLLYTSPSPRDTR